MIGIFFWCCVLLVVYIYAGYPLLVTILAGFRTKSIESTPYLAKVTLIIAAYNEEVCIASKLENTLNLNYPKELLQILVAADGSDDGTVDIVKNYEKSGIELSYSPERLGKMMAVNNAIPKAQGDIIVFSDANNIFHPDSLGYLLSPFADPSVGAVSGAKMIRSGHQPLSASEGLYWKYESFIKKQETRLGSCTGVNGEILAIRRSLFKQPPAQVINDDFYIALGVIRQGYRLVYEPRAYSVEDVSASARDEITRRTRIIAGRYQAMSMAAELIPWNKPLVAWQVISHKFLRPIIPIAMIFAVVLNIVAILIPQTPGYSALLRLAPPFSILIFLLQGLFYVVAFLGNFFKNRGIIGRIFYLPTFLVNSNLASLMGLYRYLTRQQTVVWDKVKRQNNNIMMKEPE